MPNLIKQATTVQEIGIYDSSAITNVTQFTRIANNKNSSYVFETTQGSFEKNTVEANAAYFTSDDTNPLIHGLNMLDRAARVIDGKGSCGVFAFTSGLTCSTPDFIKTTTISEANDIILKNLGMREPILKGVPLKREQAIRFNALSLNITRDVRRGNPVYAKYINDVILIGVEAMKEWINGN